MNYKTAFFVTVAVAAFMGYRLYQYSGAFLTQTQRAA